MFSNAIKGLFTSVIFINTAVKLADSFSYDQLRNTKHDCFSSNQLFTYVCDYT